MDLVSGYPLKKRPTEFKVLYMDMDMYPHVLAMWGSTIVASWTFTLMAC